MRFERLRFVQLVNVLAGIVGMVVMLAIHPAAAQEKKAYKEGERGHTKKKKAGKAKGKQGDDSKIEITGGSLHMKSNAFRTAYGTLEKQVVASCPVNPRHKVPSIVFNAMVGQPLRRPIQPTDVWSLSISSHNIVVLGTGQGPIVIEDRDPDPMKGFQTNGKERTYTPEIAFWGLVFTLNYDVVSTPCDTSKKCQIRIDYPSDDTDCRPD